MENESGWERSRRSPAANAMCAASGCFGGPKWVPGRMQHGFIPWEKKSVGLSEMEE